MFAIPRRHSHFVFGVLQSGMTSLVAAGIASFPAMATDNFLWNWLASWLVSWAVMSPIVLLAAPTIRSLSMVLTGESLD